MKPPMHPAWSWFFLALVPFAAAGLAPRALAAEPDADAAPAATTPPRITAVPSAIDLVVNTVDGYVDIDVDNLPALPAASFVTSAVEQPEVFFEALPVDTTPDTPYDDLSQVRYHAMVQSLTTPFVRHDFDFIVRAAQAGTSIRVYAGPDVDGDGMPDASEERCRGAEGSVSQCVFHLEDVFESQRWWFVVQRVSGDASDVRVEAAMARVGCAPGCAPGGQLYASGPGHVDAGEPFRIRLAWDVPSFGLEKPHLGALHIQYLPGTALRLIPVRILPRDVVATPKRLDRTRVFLRPGRRHDRMFIDVPPRTAYLSLRTIAASPDQNGLGSLQIAYAGPVPNGPTLGATPTGGTTGSIQNPVPGRYFVTLTNVGDKPINYALTARLTLVSGISPAVAPGSYYNPSRPGHGVFLYPAGPDGALLWYTYRDDGTPTWYYAQGPRTATTPWVWPSSSHAKLMPPEFVRFVRMTFPTGAEALKPWLEGCGAVGGTPVDANGHWYDPAAPGYGFSAQTHPDYEFIAGFLFDANGEPRFLAAERGGAFDAAASPLPLYQLKGFAPLAPWTAPIRTEVGVLGRIYSTIGLEHVAVEGEFVDGVPGGWSSSAPVLRLGDAVGCE